MFKKLCCLALGVSGIFLSAQACPKPDMPSGVEISLEGFYLRPNSDYLQYAAVFPTTPSIPGTTGIIEIKKVRPDSELGYKIGLSYRFPCTCNDVDIDWRHLNTDSTNSVSAQENEVIQLPFLLGSNNPSYTHGRGKVRFKYDAVDLSAGHYLNFCKFQTHIYAGVRFARIDRNFDILVDQPVQGRDDGSPRSINIISDSKIDGVGPQLGINSSYYFTPCYGLGIEGDVSFAGIVSRAKAHSDILVSLEDDTTQKFGLKPDHQNIIIPVVDAKLGLLYHYQFCGGTRLKVSAGYEFVSYIDALSQPVISAGQNGIDFIDYKKFNANFNGPYVAISLKI